MVSPNFYRSIFRQWLDVNGLRVLDAQPDASKAAAVMLSGGEYICRQPDQFRGLAEFLKGKLNIAQPGTYDVMFLNGIRNLATADMKPLIERSLSLAKTLVVCVRSSAQTELAQHFKPKRILRLSNRQGTTAWKDNHIMLIEPK